MTQLDGQQLKKKALGTLEEREAVFLAATREIAEGIAKRHIFVTIDDVRELADRQGIKPQHCNGWGAVLNAPQFWHVRYVPSRRPSNHGRKIGQYRLVAVA